MKAHLTSLLSIAFLFLLSVSLPSYASNKPNSSGLCIGDCMVIESYEDKDDFEDLDIFFEFNEFELDDENKARLKNFAQLLKKTPNFNIEIQGHTDERGTNNKNIELGEKRAVAVKKFLVKMGVNSARLNAISYGEEKPFCKEHNEKCWNQNNRVHFLFVVGEDKPRDKKDLKAEKLTKEGPGYDCSKANKWDEKLICQNRELSKLDVVLNYAYEEILKSTSDTKLKAAIKNYQIGWLRDRSNCKDWYKHNIRELDLIEDSECLKEIYQVRIDELKNLSNTIEDIKKGNPFGYYNMGNLYNSGKVIEKDNVEAKKWFLYTTRDMGKALDASCLTRINFGDPWNWFVFDNRTSSKELNDDFSIYSKDLDKFRSRTSYYADCEYKSIAVDGEGVIKSISDYGDEEYKILGRLDNGIYVIFGYNPHAPHEEYSSIRFVKGSLWESGRITGKLIQLGQIIYADWRPPKIWLRGNTVTIFFGDGVIQIDLEKWKELISVKKLFPVKSKNNYTGKVGSKNIEANLSFNEFNISGVISHKDNGKTYEAKGYVNNFVFKLKEFKNSQVVGEYKGKFRSNQNLSGVWSGSNQAKETSFYLALKEDSECQYLSGWTGLSDKSEAYVNNKAFRLFVDGKKVNLTFLPTGETITIEIMEYEHFGSAGTPDRYFMKNRVQLSQNESLAVVSGEDTSKISLYDTSTWEKVGTLEYATFSLSPNGKYLAVAGFSWKNGWMLDIYEIDRIQKKFIVGKKREINSRLCSNESSDCEDAEWYQGQEFGFSKDSKYLLVDYLQGEFKYYDPENNSVKNILCKTFSPVKKPMDK